MEKLTCRGWWYAHTKMYSICVLHTLPPWAKFTKEDPHLMQTHHKIEMARDMVTLTPFFTIKIIQKGVTFIRQRLLSLH